MFRFRFDWYNTGWAKKGATLKRNHLKTIRGDQKNVPPSRAEKKNSPGNLSIAFSNTTYLNIVRRFSSTTMHYVSMTHTVK